ncbi:MAG: hypothetical protein K8R89_03630 [Anaerolineae bacterium]|nr:hypothetical protein [Anaerolineae bacterium]
MKNQDEHSRNTGGYLEFTASTPDVTVLAEYLLRFGVEPDEVSLNEYGYKAAGPIGGYPTEEAPRQLTLIAEEA